jgi:TusA-related sulfurtransferase
MVHTLDITKEHCPMTFVKVKLMLSRIANGDMLDVTLSEGEPLQNVPRSAAEQGHRIVEIRQEGVVHHVVIEKRS